MASAQPSDRPGERHRVAQAGLGTLVAAAVRHAFASLLDPHDLKGTSPKLAVAVEAITTHYGRASSSAALTHYRNERRAAGVTGRPKLTMPPVPTPEAVRATVEHALTPLYGPVTPELEQKAQEELASEVEQLVLDQSRDAIINAVHSDKEARAWARVTEPGACSFCRLLGTRGAVYRTEESGGFEAHTNCRCHAEPVFGAYEMTAQARQDLADYQRLADEFGHSGRDIHVAWRQHVEGRPVTGPLTKPYTRRK